MSAINRARLRKGRSPVQGPARSRRTRILTQAAWLQCANTIVPGRNHGGKLPGLHHREVVVSGGCFQDGEWGAEILGDPGRQS